MTWKKDKWLLTTTAFALLMWLAVHKHNIGPAMVASWFCGAHFISWCAVHNPPKSGGDTALREKP